MLTFWIVMAAVIYFVLLSAVLVFLSAAGRMNRHWERVIRESQGDCDVELRRAA